MLRRFPPYAAQSQPLLAPFTHFDWSDASVETMNDVSGGILMRETLSKVLC